jgi:predicted permease
MRLVLPEHRYPSGDARLRFFERIEEELATIPGIETVAYANNLPLRGGWGSGFRIDGVPQPATGSFSADFQAVSAGYFRTLGITLAEGRLLSRTDHQQSRAVAVVSRMFEQRFLNGASAIGRQIRRGPEMPPITIVGIVDDVRRDGRRSALNPQVYLAATQTSVYPVRLADLAIRSTLPIAELMPRVRSVVSSIDPEQAISSVRTLDDILVANAASQRFQALLFSMFAVLALVLASVGTYGVVSYVVSQRTPEIGVRLALGAGAWNVYRWLLERTATLLVVGILVGLATARVLGRYVSALLFDVTASDTPTYVLAATVLLTVALMASVVAGRRALRIDPTAALRGE